MVGWNGEWSKDTGKERKIEREETVEAEEKIEEEKELEGIRSVDEEKVKVDTSNT